MRFWLTLKSRLKELMNYLLAPVVPTSTALIADGVRVPLMRLLGILVRTLGTLPDRLLIFLMSIALWLLGALIIWMILPR